MNPSKVKRMVCLFSALAFLSFIAACGKPYVGRAVNTFNPYWCQCPNLPKTCILGDEGGWFIFEFTISRTASEDTYLIEGTIDPTKGCVKSFGHLMSKDCRFSLVLASSKNSQFSSIYENNWIVTDNISFRPLGQSLSRKMPFRKEFTTTPFDAVLIDWKAWVRG